MSPDKDPAGERVGATTPVTSGAINYGTIQSPSVSIPFLDYIIIYIVYC